MKPATSRGVVVELLPQLFYKVLIDSKEYICHCSGKMRLHNIKVLVGDSVEVVIDPYGGKTSNRIVTRL